MGALHKAMVYLGFRADPYDDEYDDYEHDDGHLAPVTPLHDVNHPRHGRNPVSAPTQPRPMTDLTRIQKVMPRSYNDARVIGEAFREGVPVIMNLTEMSDGDAKRLVDFSAGLSFGLHGTLERVATSVFLVSPAHIEIGVDSESSSTERGFFNQS